MYRGRRLCLDTYSAGFLIFSSYIPFLMFRGYVCISPGDKTFIDINVLFVRKGIKGIRVNKPPICFIHMVGGVILFCHQTNNGI